MPRLASYCYDAGGNGKVHDDSETLGLDVGQGSDCWACGWFLSVDPLAHQFASQTPYNFVFNNPINLVDPDGRAPEHVETTIVEDNYDGTYTVKEVINDGETDNIDEMGKKIGNSLSSWSFTDDDDNAVEGAIIDMKSTAGQDFLDQRIINANGGGGVTNWFYMDNAKGGEPLDFKINGINERGGEFNPLQHKYRGSVLADGRVASARDIGIFAAGIVAGRGGKSWKQARSAFDALQTYQNGFWKSLRSGPGTEARVSIRAQWEGYELGLQLLRQDQTANSENDRP